MIRVGGLELAPERREGAMANIATLQTVANDARTAARRQEVTINSELASIDTLISALQQAKTQLSSGSNDASSVQATLSGLRSAVDEAQVVERIAAEHKALHGSISKLCKTAEKVKRTIHRYSSRL
jgi:chromosome segregation ATPase